MYERMEISSSPAIKAGRRIDRSRFEDLRPPLVMGVLNTTPDSFSDGGMFLDPEKAVLHGMSMVEDGADIIDIGGESTRPFAQSVSLDSELGRVLPVVKGLAKRTGVPLSIDTRHPEVARACLEEGCSIINDISAFSDPTMERLLKESDATGVIMHMQGDPASMQISPSYVDVVQEVHSYLLSRVEHLTSHGIRRDRLLIDPGIGFGKTVEGNILLLRHLDRFRDIGCHVLVGTSRKSFLGKLLGTNEPKDRLEGSIASMLISISNGASVVRVHDVRSTKRAIIVQRSILGK
ncbi:MAG: dihydropteroate synthase [Candidatus Thermoplasmatota archaeon]|nr:dihydropteroate synthase [Candidatus Thermoplasmatota archaeon]